MLVHLSIKNYALIDNLEIDFKDGLSIITGETGAGKSILLGALGLILGQRAEMQVIKDAEEKCVIEGIFNIDSLFLNDFFKANDIDYAVQAILRREIKINGTSRAFINDTPVSLNVLKELGTFLLDIHSQHQNLLLTEGRFQLEVLDAVSANKKLLEKYKDVFLLRQSRLKQLHSLQEREKESKLKQDFLQFQFDELSNANIKAGELLQTEEQLKTLENAEEIKLSLNAAKNQLTDNELNIVTFLKQVKQQLSVAVKYNQECEDLLQRIESSIIELSDVSNEIEIIEEKVIHDPERIALLNERVNLINGLLQKHFVKTDEELFEIINDIEKQLLEVSTLESDIQSLENEILVLDKEIFLIANEIGANRRGNKEILEKETEKILMQLGMPQAKLNISIEELADYTISGKDKVTFLFSANKGGALNEISKVASGGEISRLMLSIKSIISKYKTLPAIIFDEIDTGVSGEVAAKLGVVLNELGKNMQVIVITHLPQIAGKGQQHYEVYKYSEGNKTKSNIKLLSQEERVFEIAKMLSGEKPSAIALENAKELLL
jgi:DNA repair protein RecN (Recombination protein N)